MTSTKAYSALSAKAQVRPTEIQRRPVGINDVQIEIEHCGVCHTDIHFVNNDGGMTNYPVVPRHEIVGRVTEVGSAVQNLKLAIRQQSVASLIHVGLVPIVKRALNSTV